MNIILTTNNLRQRTTTVVLNWDIDTNVQYIYQCSSIINYTIKAEILFDFANRILPMFLLKE